MPKFAYTAKSSPQKTIQATIEADSEQDAINKLTRMGYFPISVRSEDSALEKLGASGSRKFSNRDLVTMTRQLSSLSESGVNIINSLDILYTQTPNQYLKTVLADVMAKIKDGKSLSESLATYPKLFSNLYTSIVRSGEIGGNIDATLKRLADFLEKEEEFKNTIRAALTYPIFVLSVGALTVIALLTFVIPRLVSMFEDIGQVLPLPTRILIAISSGMRTYWWLILAIIAAAIFLLRRASHSQQGKLAIDNFKLKIAVLGDAILKTEVSRLMRTLSLLLSSGIPIVYALEISSSVLENEVIRNQIQGFKEKISGGSNLSKCIKESKIFPIFVVNIVTVGEESGTLEISLLRIADNYDREVDRTLKSLTRLLEPIIILVMGLVVGFIVLSMLLPIFQINIIVK